MSDDFNFDIDLDLKAAEELINNLDLSDYTIDDFILGLPELTMEDLLNRLKSGANEAKLAYDSGLFQKGPDGMQAYHDIGRHYSRVACEIYNRLKKKLEEPRLPIYLAVNRFNSSDACPPELPLFWAYPDAITGLYNALEKDGYYGQLAVSR